MPMPAMFALRPLLERRGRQLALRAARLPPLGRFLCLRGPAKSGCVALTFDDGPNPEHTPAVLETLARHGANATFFVLGQQVERHPELFDRIRDAGHEIGNHGYDHTPYDLPLQARRTQEILRARGVETRLFRPPRGRIRPRAALALALYGYRTLLWSFDARDSMRAEGKYRGAIHYDELQSGDIALFHDDNPVCAAELGPLLTELRYRELTPVAVSSLLAPAEPRRSRRATGPTTAHEGAPPRLAGAAWKRRRVA